MLHRPPARRRTRADQRERRRLAQQRYRQRFDAGLITVAVEIDGTDGDVVEMLVASHWLEPVKQGETHDRAEIGKALSAMVAEAAKR
ncbi:MULTISPECIES: hypothetical protein [unclassified Bradyrhizobium]|uniref:hypothetical protein n=1 Tax=unclassified Bradyrhizobium TaxID=2631580 RepID=UPI0033969204